LATLVIESLTKRLDEHAGGQTPVVQQPDGFVEFDQRFRVDVLDFEWL
jgi:hypothetical protein